MGQDVFVSGHFDLAFATVEEEVGEMRSPVEAAHVQAGDRGFLHMFPTDAALVENLVGGKEVLPGGGFFGEVSATFAAPDHRGAAAGAVVLARARFLPFSREFLPGVPTLRR